MKITNKELHREIREFNNKQKLNIVPEMFILWEYKLTKTDGSKDSLFSILKNDNVYLKVDKKIKNTSELEADEFFFMLSLYKEHNTKLNAFCYKMIKEFN